MRSEYRVRQTIIALLLTGVNVTALAVEQSAIEHVESQRFRVEQWDLDDTEWQRYETLMQGIRGSVSPASLSPIEVLGIHASTDAERQRYAERWAVMMREDAERILAFQRAYDVASRRLFPDSVLIDPQRTPINPSHPDWNAPFTWQASDRVLFFTDTQCPACDAVLERLVSQIDHFAGVDLYLIDVSAGEEARIREWAAAQRIDPQWVNQHKITLNRDGGALDKVTANTGLSRPKIPILILRREDRLTPLPVSRF